MYDSLGPETLGTIMTGAKETTPSGSKKRCVIAPFSDGFVVINVECECYYEEIKEQDCTCYKPKNLLLSFLPESKKYFNFTEMALLRQVFLSHDFIIFKKSS